MVNSPVVSTTLCEVFGQLSSRAFLFIEPGGNAGDSLIYKGAYKLADRMALRYRTAKHEEIVDQLNAVPEDNVIYVHGGGGFVPWWSGKPIVALKKIISTFGGIVIVGPTTFSDDVGYLKESFVDSISEGRCKKLYIFTREHTSYLVLKQCLPSWVVLLEDHDTALNLQASDFDTSLLRQKYAFYAIRMDKETRTAQKTNVFSRRLDPVLYSQSFDEWFLLHARAKEIITNRLHSSIISSILGKPTTLMPNSYHKNRSVWEFSLADRGVLWREELPVGPFNAWLSDRSFVRRLRFCSITEKMIKRYLLGFS